MICHRILPSPVRVAPVRAGFTLAALLGPGLVAAMAFVNETTPAGVSLRWNVEQFLGCDGDPFCVPPDQNPATLAIRFRLPSQPWSAATKTNEWNAIRAAFGQWQAIAGTKIKFEEAGVTGNVTDVNPEDGKNMVVWLPANQSYCGGRVFLGSTTTATTCLSYFEDGTMAEADIILNKSLNWFTDFNDTASLSFFIEGVALHEIGHLLGLNHSPAGGATMFYFGKAGVGAQAGLSADDIAGARALYGTAPTLASLATMRGTVTLNGIGVFGAVVVAEDAHGNIAAAGLSRSGGSYQLPGLPPGNYSVRVTPLDPTGNLDAYLVRGADIDDYSATFAGANTAFQPSAAIAVNLPAGSTTKNLTVASGNPPFRITEVRNSLNAGDRNSGDVTLQLHPGQAGAYVGVFVPGLGASPATIRLSGDGLTYGAVQLIPNALRGMTLVQVPVTVATDAAPGLRSIAVESGGNTAWANGFAEILPAVPDANFDGLDDVFQRKWFAPFTRAEAAPGADPDGDGWINSREAAAGSNPTDAASYIYRILSTKVAAQGTTVTWESVSGKRYQLYSRALIEGASWQAVGGPVTAVGETTQKLDVQAQAALRFYRVQSMP